VSPQNQPTCMPVYGVILPIHMSVWSLSTQIHVSIGVPVHYICTWWMTWPAPVHYSCVVDDAASTGTYVVDAVNEVAGMIRPALSAGRTALHHAAMHNCGGAAGGY
jgi:hypothetical protein